MININMQSGNIQKEDDIIVGIDLGTTNSLIAIVENNQPKILLENNQHALVPSVIHFLNSNEVIVGKKAKEKFTENPNQTISSVKRLMGKSYKDIANHQNYFSYKIIDNNTDQLVKIQIHEKFYTPIELSAFILKELKERAEKILKKDISKAVITVPAYFNDAQRQATRDAGKLAGLDVLRIINEPTAAGLAYGIGIHPKEEKTIAVYDLGGGTFDISILKIHNGIFEVLATCGDTYLGGDDIDHAIIEYWIEENTNLNNLHSQLKPIAEKAKIILSEKDNFSILFQQKTLELSKNTLRQLATPIIQKTLKNCTQVLNDGKLSTSEINEVIMVGGSTRMPLVKELVSEFFKQSVNDHINPDEVVALGAAVQANILAGKNTEFLLLDITPLSLGIETMGGLMDILIPRNSKVPTQYSRQYTTQKDGQKNMRITVYQGERDLVLDNRKLAEFHFNNIPPMPAGLPKIEISFLLNADGILRVKAKELIHNIEQSIDVKPQYGITDSEVESLLKDSILNAKTDRDTRALVEAKTEAEQIIEVTQTFLKKYSLELSQQEIDKTKDIIKNLQEKLSLNDKNEIQFVTEFLNEYTTPFAQRIMNKALSENMKGQKIE
ncbi:MAG: Fe-S protein assembly chaperone HscA [Chitinophagaceae bacterium]